MRALVTGACGFVGKYLVEELRRLGHQVCTTDEAKSKWDDISHLQIDIRLIKSDHIKDINPDVIFHLAAKSITSLPQDPDEYFDVNFNGTKRLYDAVLKSRIRPRIIFVSSGDAYGFVKDEENPIKEEQPLRPLNTYQASKACADILSKMYAKNKGLDIVIIRPFNHTGVGQTTNFVCPAFAYQIVQIEKGKQDRIQVGNLSPLRDFLDVRDVVKAYILAVEKAESGEVYNVSSAKGYRIKDILDMLLSFSTAQVDVVVDEARVRVKEVNVRIGDNTKFAKQTGWQPSYEIKNTLKEILQEFRRIL